MDCARQNRRTNLARSSAIRKSSLIAANADWKDEYPPDYAKDAPAQAASHSTRVNRQTKSEQ
jgi:hypothetical protein